MAKAANEPLTFIVPKVKFGAALPFGYKFIFGYANTHFYDYSEGP